MLALMVRAHGLSKGITKAFEPHQFVDFDQVSPELMLETHQALMALRVFEIPKGLLALDALTIGRALGVMHEHWSEIREAASQEAADLSDRIARLDTLAAEIRGGSLAAVNEFKRHIGKRESAVRSMDG